jgi:coiled-coil domain-containing protein 63/114
MQRLDSEITQLEKEISNERVKMGGVDASKNNENVEKQIRVLENRLDKALMKFSKALATNKQLRESIDSLRRERLVFDSMYRKFERELQEQKKSMAELIDMSNSAYEARFVIIVIILLRREIRSP